jgi:hypothetical protein
MAMFRVAKHLTELAPRGLEFVRRESEADVIVLHAIGYPETVEAVRRIVARGQRYAIIQYCLRTTQQPNTRPWLPLWAEADCVWSYYDLFDLIVHDGSALDGTYGINFYQAPLGVDPEQFYPESSEKKYTLFTSGYVADSECINECAEAVKRVNGKMFHLGPHLDLDPRYVHSALGITDGQLRDVYQTCLFVAGLRREEGFELPAAEGLICGARPIMFDAPHYRTWFDPWAEFIPERDPQSVVESLVTLFKKGARPVTARESYSATVRFDWFRIVNGFWQYVQEASTYEPRVAYYRS